MSDHAARPLATGSLGNGAPDQLQATTAETSHDVANDNEIQVNQDENPEDATESEHDVSSNADLSDFDDEDPDGSDDLVEGLAAERATWDAMNEGGLHKSKAEPSGSTTMDQASSATVTTVLDVKDDEENDTQDEDYQPESDQDSDEESSADSDEEEDEEAETDAPDDLVEGLAEESATWTAIVEGYRQSEAGSSGTITTTQIQVSTATVPTPTFEDINEDEEDDIQDEDYRPESDDDSNEESSDDSNDEDDGETDAESNATDALLDGLAQERATWATMLTLKQRLDEEVLKPAVAQASGNQQEEAGDNNVDTDSQDEDYIPPPSVKEQDSSEDPEEVQDDADEENDSDGDEDPVADIWNNFLQSLTYENANWDTRLNMHREETKRAALMKMLKDIPSMENTPHNASASGAISSEPGMTLDGLAAYMVSSIQTRSNFHGKAGTELIEALGLSVPDSSDDESSDPTYQPDEIDSKDEYSDDEEDDSASQDDDEMVEGLTNEIAAWNSILKRKREACSRNLNPLE